MKTYTFQLPDTIDMTPKEVTTALAAQLYKMGKLSLGQAADLAGYSKRTFMELLGNYGVSVFNYSAEDLENEAKDLAYWLSKSPKERIAAVTTIISQSLKPGARLDKSVVIKRKAKG